MNHAAGDFFSPGYRGFRKAPLRYCFLHLTLSLLSCFFNTSVSAQDLDNLLKTANAHFDKEQYHTAAQYYQVAAGLRDDDPVTAYHLAQCYRAIFNYSQAAHYYHRTMELDEISYPLSPYYLAQMQKSMGYFKKARDGFEHFIQTNTTSSFIPIDEKDNLIKQAEVEIEGCSWAIEQLGKYWRDIGFTNLPEPVNSSSNDYAAVAAANDNVVTITSGRKGVRGGLVDNRFGEYFTDNFRYKNEGNLWTPESSSDHFDRTNTKFSDGVGTYNDAGDKYYFTSCYEGSAFCKLYVTYHENGVWKNPEMLNDNVNAPGYDNKHPTLTPGGDTLIFVSNRPGGPGGNDLWFSVSNSGEAWEDPRPLSEDINTPFNEASPYCHQGNLLFFSSDGRFGMGGMDIFMAEDYQSSNMKIKNLGTPFNSGFDDSFFSLSASKGYLSSNRPNGHGKFDIYGFNLPTENSDPARFLEESAESTQLRSRIRSNDGCSLYSARDEDQFYYDNLTAEERARLDRIIGMKQQTEVEFDSKQLSKDDSRYYKKLDISTKATIERLAQKQVLELEGLAPVNHMTPQERLDWEFYQNIDEGERAIIDRIINIKVEGRRNAMTRMSPEEQLYTSSSSNQERIESKIQLRSLDLQAESLKEQHQVGVEKFNQNQRALSISSGSQEKPRVTGEIALQKSNEYLKLIEELGFSHQLYYQELSPEERDNLHQSAARQYIINNDLLNPAERDQLLAELNLETDPMSYPTDHLKSSQHQMSLDIKQAIMHNLLTTRSTYSQISFKDQLFMELDAQQLMLKEQLELISKKETHIRSLQQQLQQALNEQEQTSNPVIEQRIVDQFYNQSINLLPLLTPKDSYYFNALSPGRQLRMDRLAILVGLQTQKQEMVTGTESDYVASLTPTDQWFYLELPQEDQVIIDELVARGWSPDIPYSGEKKEFIDELSPLERNRINRMMETRHKLKFGLHDNGQISINAQEMNDSTVLLGYDQSLSSDQETKILESSDKQLKIVSYLGAQVHFDFDRHSLRTEAKKALDELVSFLDQQEKPVTILVEGHTDNIGSTSYNQELGRRRSLTVARFFQPFSDLIEISTKSYGENQTATNNNTPMGRQLNRRVELKIQGIRYESPLRTYLVKPKATILMITAATGISEGQVMEWNGLNNKVLRAYQPLRLPIDLDLRKINNLLYYPYKYQANSDTVKYHTVTSGENLYRLALKYNTSVEMLEDLNNITARELKSGQQLRIR